MNSRAEPFFQQKDSTQALQGTQYFKALKEKKKKLRHLPEDGYEIEEVNRKRRTRPVLFPSPILRKRTGKYDPSNYRTAHTHTKAKTRKDESPLVLFYFRLRLFAPHFTKNVRNWPIEGGRYTRWHQKKKKQL